MALMMFNEGDYLTVMPFFHKAQLILDCKLTLESVPETNQYLAMRVTFFLLKETTGTFGGTLMCYQSLYWPITLMAVYVLSCVFPCTGQ